MCEFLLPLWAGVQLGASAGVSGGLLTLELLGSLIGRILAGRLLSLTTATSRGLAPVITLTGVTALTQSSLLLLAMFQLQRGLSMEIQDVGLILGPGYLLFVVAAAKSHRVASVLGMTRTLYVSLGAAATMAALLSVAEGAVGVAVAWCAAAVGLGLALPVERAVVAKRSQGRVGRAFGMHGVAALGGSSLGAALAGWMFDSVPWLVACSVIAALTVFGLLLVASATRS